jgi:hypothetical protein
VPTINWGAGRSGTEIWTGRQAAGYACAVSDATPAVDRPKDIYRPFSRQESDLLRRFVENVRRLGGMRFFDEVPTSATQRMNVSGWESEMEEPDDEALRAAITQFRHIYDHKEPHSFQKAVKLLKRSAHDRGGPERDAAIKLLEGHLEAERKAISRASVMGIVFERPSGSDPVDTRRIIDAYFHGYYLHSGNEKSALAKDLDGLQPWPRYTMYNAMHFASGVYWNAANATQRVLDVSELLDSDRVVS